MTVSSASFYKMRGSISSGEYPLLTAGQNLAPFLVHTVSVKYARGLQTRITVPEFTNWTTANIVEIDGAFYWISEARESTIYNGSVEFILDYMGPTSWFRNGTSVKGAFHKTATNECPYLKQVISNGQMHYVNGQLPQTLNIPILVEAPDTDYYGYWVQVTGFTDSQHTRINKVGWFMAWNERANNFTTTGVVADDSGHLFPIWSDMIEDITALTGIQADQIIDCSISKRCPFPFYTWTYSQSEDTRIYAISILDANGDAVAPVSTSTGRYVIVLNSALYNPAMSDMSAELTIDTSDAYTRQCGALALIDWNRNEIMTIPIRSSSTTIQFRVHSDISGIYTIVSAGQQQISVPEGKLPYIEDAWETYKAYQMDTDRFAMMNAINYARINKETLDIAGIANTAISAVNTGVMTGAIAGNVAGAVAGIASGVAGAGVTLWQNQRAVELAELQARDAYEQSKRYAVEQPQTSYNVAYGLIYCYLNQLNSLMIVKSMPLDVDSAYFNNWCNEYGYPCEGVRTVNIAAGYYQGKLLSDSVEKSGQYWDECNKTFMNGFKFIEPS